MPSSCAYTGVIMHDPESLHPYGLGLADQGVKGYTPVPHPGFDTYQDAMNEATRLNREVFGLNPKEAVLIVLSTLDMGGSR